MTPTHIPALRTTLRLMLDDTAYSEAWKDCRFVEARLREAGWPPRTLAQLRTLALRWVSTQREDVRVSMRKALGEDVTEEELARLPSRVRLGSTQYALTTTPQGVAMSTIAQTIDEHNATILRPEDGPVSELYGSPALKELAIIADQMNQPPFNTPPSKHEKAYATCRDGRVREIEEALWEVDGSKPEPYLVDRLGCSCASGQKNQRTRYACYHAVAAEMYQRWQRALQPGLFPPPKTIDERLAAAPGLPTVASGPQNDPEHIYAPNAPLGAPRGQKKEPAMATALTAVQPPPVTLPTLPAMLGLRSITAIVADLSKPLPAQCIAQLPASAKKPAQEYLHWHTVAAILDAYAPGWEGSIVRIDKVGERCAVTYRLTLHAAEGAFSQEDAGMEDEDKDDYGDAMTNAIATAMKRAAVKFGLGRTLYDKDKKTAAFLEHLRGEKQQALAELGKVLVAKGLERKQALAWLKMQAGVTSIDQLPLAAVRTMLAYVAQHEEA